VEDEDEAERGREGRREGGMMIISPEMLPSKSEREGGREGGRAGFSYLVTTRKKPQMLTVWVPLHL